MNESRHRPSISPSDVSLVSRCLRLQDGAIRPVHGCGDRDPHPDLHRRGAPPRPGAPAPREVPLYPP